MIEPGKNVKQHDLHMRSRKAVDLTGVQNVESFDSEEFKLQTELGILVIRGTHLHIKNLSLENGLLSVEGNVHSLIYLDPGAKGNNKGLLGKLFK
ncbi:sporulation protein YabP [Paenibacillus sophorae]|uniref:Sporulation protein YabP n=1 Tax=Paenibacillus sophorae TaxID=1333845 RepID=A0A1H8V585_9BACL|nr:MULTISPECIES: sporulation protein YabP [Paenibacillus]QWU16343.1 sporulation protein YabP [Paenibacillus sophorae]SEP10566.1 sporulation protein YabP [Paenibacillus sophorae]